MLLDRLTRKLEHRRWTRLRASHTARPFEGLPRRFLLVALPERIPQSQTFPFHYYADALRDELNVEVREIQPDAFLRGDTPARDATHVFFQSAFDLDAAALSPLLAALKANSPGARRIYLDWAAPSDLRLAPLLAPHIDVYVKKNLLRDRTAYTRPTFGDTNLMDYYGKRFGLAHDVQQNTLPDGFARRLVNGPSFVTADFLLPRLARHGLPTGPREIDLHARVAVQGTPWYQAMRGECVEAVSRLNGVRSVTGTGIGQPQFLAELRASKICFSPFGYGEVCWRDFEAIQSGAVLLKQSMSHLDGVPDIFRDGETYIALNWDLSDFEEKVALLLGDDALRERLAHNAYDALAGWVRSGGFMTHVREVLDRCEGVP